MIAAGRRAQDYATRHEDSLTAELSLFGRARFGAEWLVRRKGLGASNFFETGAFLCTRDDIAFPNLQYEFLPLSRQLRRGKLVPVPGFQSWMDLSRPESLGAVTFCGRRTQLTPRRSCSNTPTAEETSRS